MIRRTGLGLAFLSLALFVCGAAFAAGDPPIDPRLNLVTEESPENRVRHYNLALDVVDEGFVELPEPIDDPEPMSNALPKGSARGFVGMDIGGNGLAGAGQVRGPSFSSGIVSSPSGGGAASRIERVERAIVEVLDDLG